MAWSVPDFARFPQDDLERLIAELTARETELSRERRVVQGQLDILVAERDARAKNGSLTPVDVDELAAILSRNGSADGVDAKA
jgi:hypothetical protein